MSVVRQQISMVLSQRFSPKVGDIDDCWVLSAIMLAFASLPWLSLPDTKAFREAARDPDDGVTDGGSQTEIMRGLRRTWPELNGHLHRVDGGTFATMVLALSQNRPVSVAVDSSRLPNPMGFKGAHRVNLAKTPNGKAWIGNPLASPYAPWELLPGGFEDVRDAVMAYGLSSARQERGAWFISGPSPEEAIRLHPAWGPELAETVKRITAELQAEVKELRDEVTKLSTTGQKAVEAAKAAIRTNTEFVATFGGQP